MTTIPEAPEQDETWDEDIHLVTLQVNGRRHRLHIPARRMLADVLRHDLGLTGTHLGCEHGICGACTVLLDGAPVRSCLVFGVQADGCSVTTVESLADGDHLGDLQDAFHRNHALQCGFCTPGFLMLAEGYLSQNPQPDAQAVRELVASNLCRCTGYSGIVQAVTEVAGSRARMRGQAPAESDVPAGSGSGEAGTGDTDVQARG